MTSRDLVGQRARLRLGEHAGITTAAQAAKFLENVGVALRYGPSDKLLLASMYQAVWRLLPRPEPEQDGQRRAAILTNALIDHGTAIEITAIAERVALVHVSLAPAVYALRRRVPREDIPLSDNAQRVLAFVATSDRPTAGQVRAMLGVPPKTWPNPADAALGELQGHLLVDRGAVEVPATGAPYLGKDGIPYRIFDETHPVVAAAAAKLSVADAAATLVEHYLRGARFGERRKLASMFKLCMSRDELDAAIAALVARKRIAEDGTAVVALDR